MLSKKIIEGMLFLLSEISDIIFLLAPSDLESCYLCWNLFICICSLQLSLSLEQSKKNKSNRQLLDDMHTMGPRSYAMLRHKLQQEDPNKQEPSHAKLYKESRKRNSTKKYKTSFENTKANMEKMEVLESQVHEEGTNNIEDPYYQVIKKAEHSGRVRLYEKCVTKSTLKNEGNKTSYIFPQEFLQSLQIQLKEKLEEAIPGVDLVIPIFFGTGSSRNSTDGASETYELNGGHPNIVEKSSTQVRVRQDGMEAEHA